MEVRRGKAKEMVAGAEVIHQSISVLDVPYRCIAKEIEEMIDISAAAAAVAAPRPPSPGIRRGTEAVVVDVAATQLVSITVRSLTSFLMWMSRSFKSL